MQLDRLTTRADIRANMWHISNSPLGSHRLTPVPILEKWMWLDRSRARSGNLSELDGPGAYTRVNKHENVVHLVQNFHRYKKQKISKDRPCTQCCRTEWVTCSESSACVEQSAFFGGAAKDLSSRIQDSCIHTTSTHHCGHCKRYQGSVDNSTSLYGTNGMCFFTPSTFREKVGHSFQLISSTTLPTATNHSPFTVAATPGILTGHQVLTSLSQPLTTYILSH